MEQKTTMLANNKNPWMKPLFKVTLINDADIICTSPGNDPESEENEKYENGSTVYWF